MGDFAPLSAGRRTGPAAETRRGALPEIGLTLLVVAVLLVTDRERVEWLARKLRDFIDWLGTE